MSRLADNIQSFSWNDVRITVKDKKSKTPKTILHGLSGTVKAGEMLAIMGPSGCGKTTLLNYIASRKKGANIIDYDGVRYINQDQHQQVRSKDMMDISTYVEQEDYLIGSLTVRETIDFTAKLSGVSSSYRKDQVNELVTAFGLDGQANTNIGTPITKGISGGQKRRVSVASKLITEPKILFLDEPTSGLDSKASYEVMSRIKKICIDRRMIVIVSIHQPSTSTFNLFDKVQFLSGGKTVYNGNVSDVIQYFDSIGQPIPFQFNPAEYILDLISTDFDEIDVHEKKLELLENIVENWKSRESDTNHHTPLLHENSNDRSLNGQNDKEFLIYKPSNVSNTTSVVLSWINFNLYNTYVLSQRLFIKSYRDVFAYYARVFMYFGLAVLMGTVWLRLDSSQENIQPFMSALFFSGAFMSFMAVAYIPAFLEDYFNFSKERANGLYGPVPFLLSNFLVGLPFLFLIAVIFSVFTYFMINFKQTSHGFFMYLLWLFLDLIAAESLVVMVSTIFPIFVLSLALVAFFNGLWMCVQGFLVPASILNPFWYYTFYWIDYQRYVFQGMMFNEFSGRVYSCGEGCNCMYASSLQDQCLIAGEAVLESIGFNKQSMGQWIGIMFAIIIAMRMITLVALYWKK